MSDIYDLAILGGGPAGITAAIYASRARLNTIWIDKNFAPGGQITATYEVDNYPGMPGISGMDLGEAFGEHARKLGLEPQREKILSLENISGDIKTIRTKKHEYQAKTLILAFGAEHRKLDIPGEDDLGGLGVSYCATCDGAFYKDRTAVVGGETWQQRMQFFFPASVKKYILSIAVIRFGRIRLFRRRFLPAKI